MRIQEKTSHVLTLSQEEKDTLQKAQNIIDTIGANVKNSDLVMFDTHTVLNTEQLGDFANMLDDLMFYDIIY